MPRTVRIETTVLPGHRIEVCAPELPEGETATVLIMLGEAPAGKRPFREVLGGYAGGRLFTTAEEADAYVRGERDA